MMCIVVCAAATVENHLKFVSARHKQNAAAVFCQGFVAPRSIQCRQYH